MGGNCDCFFFFSPSLAFNFIIFTWSLFTCWRETSGCGIFRDTPVPSLFPVFFYFVPDCAATKVGASQLWMKFGTFFFSVCSFLLVHASRCAQEYYPQTSLSSLFWALWGPPPHPHPLQRNNVLEGKPNQCARESMESIVSSFLTWFKWGLPALKFLLAMFILKEYTLVAPTPKPSTVTIGILII